MKIKRTLFTILSSTIKQNEILVKQNFTKNTFNFSRILNPKFKCSLQQLNN
jgi:hypothetical protein